MFVKYNLDSTSGKVPSLVGSEKAPQGVRSVTEAIRQNLSDV
jgi:hypothetical protein